MKGAALFVLIPIIMAGRGLPSPGGASTEAPGPPAAAQQPSVAGAPVAQGAGRGGFGGPIELGADDSPLSPIHQQDSTSNVRMFRTGR